MSTEKIHRNALPQGFKLEEYTIDSVLGHGGFGITYLAKDHHLDQWVAIKEYLPNNLAVREGISTVYAKSSSDESAFNWGLSRFIQEAQTLAKFRHKAIVAVLRFIEANQTAYMVMEYQKGQSLEEKINKNGTLNEQELLSVVLPILDGLEKVHEIGFLHRDIKPSNIFICDNNAPLLLDFGAARQAIKNTELSLTSVVTPGYAPFEQYDSKSEQGEWTDIYALGGVMYFAIGGKQPDEVVGRLKNDTMPNAADIDQHHCSEQILNAIDWALAIDEEARPQSIPEFRKALLNKPEEVFSRNVTATPVTLLNHKNNLMFTGIILVLLLSIGVMLYDKYASDDNVNNHYAMSLLTEKNIKAFVKDFFASTEQRDAGAVTRYYANSTDYFGWGWVTKETIEQDKIGFFNKWSEVKYSLLHDKINIADTDNPKEKVINYIMNYEVVRNPSEVTKNGTKRVTGQSKYFWRLKETPFGLRIISHKERVLSRSRSNE